MAQAMGSGQQEERSPGGAKHNRCCLQCIAAPRLMRQLSLATGILVAAAERRKSGSHAVSHGIHTSETTQAPEGRNIIVAVLPTACAMGYRSFAAPRLGSKLQ